MSKIQAVSHLAFQEPGTFSLPPGKYYVGDPCYVLDRELYKTLGSFRFQSVQSSDYGLMVFDVDVEGNPARIATFPTMHGDGTYEYHGTNEDDWSHMPVDSGSLAFVDLRLCTRSDGNNRDNGGELTLFQETELRIDDHHNVYLGHDVLVEVELEDEEDEYEDDESPEDDEDED